MSEFILEIELGNAVMQSPENIAKLEEMGFTKKEIEEITNNPVYPKDW